MKRRRGTRGVNKRGEVPGEPRLRGCWWGRGHRGPPRAMDVAERRWGFLIKGAAEGRCSAPRRTLSAKKRCPSGHHLLWFFSCRHPRRPAAAQVVILGDAPPRRVPHRGLNIVAGISRSGQFNFQTSGCDPSRSPVRAPKQGRRRCEIPLQN